MKKGKGVKKEQKRVSEKKRCRVMKVFEVLNYFDHTRFFVSAKSEEEMLELMDAHFLKLLEEIKEEDATSKEQQLTVLSGDYYSGRYYQLLAQTGNIELIQKLSRGIVNRCEHQIKVYEEQPKTLQQGIESITTIESELIDQYYKVYGFSYLSDLMKNTLTFIRLKKEYALFQEGKAGFLSKVISLHNDQDAFVATQQALQKILVASQQQLHEMLEKIALQQELKEYIKQYITL